MKGTAVGELLLLVGLLAVAYLLYVQQEQLVAVELELDRIRGALAPDAPPVPPAETNSTEPVKRAPARRQPKAST